jgi:putative transposase
VNRAELVDKTHPKLSVREQCHLLGVCRSSLSYRPVRESPEDVRLMRILDEIYMKDPCVGSRRLPEVLDRDYGIRANRKRIQRLRRKMGIETIWCRQRRTSVPDNGHRKYPYLLRGRKVESADEVWCADITYIPMQQGHAYLCAVMDWHSRKVLGWAVSNTMDGSLSETALAAAVEVCGRLPEIFNTDQGSQFTSAEWTSRIEGLGVAVSMDGKGRWMDNVFIERLWRSLKYEDVYLKGYSTIGELEEGVGAWFERYNMWRPHQSLGNQTPAQVYERARKCPAPEDKNKEVA